MALVPSQNAFTFLRQWEGFRSQAYPDTGGIWTIGYGSTRWEDGTPVKAGDTCTLQQAERLLELKALQFLHEVSKYVVVSPNQNQVDAITAFVYNIGTPAFETSTFLKYLNQQNWTAAASQFVWQDANGNYHGWVYVNGHVDPGLVNRRKAEQKLFNTPVAAANFSDVVSVLNVH